MPSAPHLSQPSVDPPYLVGVFEGHFHRLPPDSQYSGVYAAHTQDDLSAYRSAGAPGGVGAGSAPSKAFERVLRRFFPSTTEEHCVGKCATQPLRSVRNSESLS